MSETRETRIRRMRMRSMRRGIREMDLILSAFSDARLERMDGAELDLYDALLHENDQDLYQWVTGQVPAPERYGDLVGDIAQALQKQPGDTS